MDPMLQKSSYYVRLWLSKKITRNYETFKVQDEVDGKKGKKGPFELYREIVAKDEIDEDDEAHRHFRYAIFLKWLHETHPDDAPYILKVIHEANQGTFPTIVKLIKMLITCITAMV